MNFVKLLFLLLVGVVCCKCYATRQARNYWVPYTEIIYKQEVHTKVVPSSCLLVEATLQPCRSIRYLKFPSFWSSNENVTEPAKADNRSRNEVNGTMLETQLSWGEYLGIYRPTVTTTKTRITTKTVQSPDVTVTYSLIGCRPESLSEKIPQCPTNAQDAPKLPAVTFATSVQPIMATSVPDNMIGNGDLSSYYNQPSFPQIGEDIHSSVDEKPTNTIADTTEALP